MLFRTPTDTSLPLACSCGFPARVEQRIARCQKPRARDEGVSSRSSDRSTEGATPGWRYTGRSAANKVGKHPGRSRTLLYARLVHEVMSEWGKGGEAGMNRLPEKRMPER